MATITTTPATTTISLARRAEAARGERYATWYGTVTLSPVVHEAGVSWLVIPDRRAAEHFGAPDYAGRVIGGICKLARGGWAAVSYDSRDHIATGEGPVNYLPDSGDRISACRALLRWRNLLGTGRAQATDNPAGWSRRNRDYLTH